MWVLIVRDECERSVKNQVSKDEQVDFATSLRVAHENFCDYFIGKANPQRTHESLYLATSYVLLYQVFTHTKYTFITPKV